MYISTYAIYYSRFSVYSTECQVEWHFICETGICLPPNMVCDGQNDCGDYQDELQDCGEFILDTWLKLTLYYPNHPQMPFLSCQWCLLLLSNKAKAAKLVVWADF